MCLISIIIPVYNAERFILKCLESVNEQTFTDFEVILVNDGSKDNSEDIIKNFIRDKTNWFLFTKQNEGVAAARNFAISQTSGNCIAFIDADDYVEPNYLEVLYKKYVSSNNNLSCCGYFDHSVYGQESITNYQTEKDCVNVYEFANLLFAQIGGVLWDKLFNASIIKSNNIKMNLEIYFYEDSIFILDYLKHINKVGICRENLYHYNRNNESSFTNRINYTWKNNVINFNKKIDSQLTHLRVAPSVIKVIIHKNIYGFVNTLIHSDKLKYYPLKKQYQIVSDIVNDEYIRKYYLFNKVSLFYRPFVFFIRYKWVIFIIVYSYLLNLLKKVYLKIFR